jgi:ubiquinol-cytochrome c reductase cytochrome c subunit
VSLVRLHHLAVALFAFAAAAHAQDPAASRGSAANGKAVFMRVGCYTCHGTVGQGGAGARLAPSALPFDGFKTWVRNGSPNWSIASGMPAFPRGTISDAELADVRAYLASLPPPPAVKDIAAFKR